MVTDRCDAPRRQAPRTIELRFERGDPEAAMAHRSWNALVQLALCNYAHGQFTSVSKEWFECCDYMSSWPHWKEVKPSLLVACEKLGGRAESPYVTVVTYPCSTDAATIGKLSINWPN